MESYLQKLSRQFDYLDNREKVSKLTVLLILLLFFSIPVTIMAILTVASFAASAAGF